MTAGEPRRDLENNPPPGGRPPGPEEARGHGREGGGPRGGDSAEVWDRRDGINFVERLDLLAEKRGREYFQGAKGGCVHFNKSEPRPLTLPQVCSVRSNQMLPASVLKPLAMECGPSACFEQYKLRRANRLVR